MLKKLDRNHRGEITPYLPKGVRRPAEPVPEDLVASTIVQIGSFRNGPRGLVIDYEFDGIMRRVVLGCSEFGVWVEATGDL